MSVITGLTIKASSTLNRNSKLYGPRNIFDGDDQTCWNSDQGTQQSLEITLPNPSALNQMEIMFQGGFVGRVRSIRYLLYNSL